MAPEGPASPRWWLWLGLGLALAVFAVLTAQQRELHRGGGDPLFPPRVVTTPGMRLSLLTVLSFFATSSGLYLVFTYYLQTGLRIEPMAAGLMFVPLGLGFSLGSAVCRRIGHRLRVSVPVAGSALVAVVLLAGGAAAQAPAHAQPPLLVAMVALAGFGQGLVVAPLVAGILSRVRPAEAGAASGMATTVTQLGLALGVALAGAWYGTVLGATPGEDGVPFADHATAFTAAAALLAGFATVTSLLSARLHRLPAARPQEEPEVARTPAAASN